MPLLLFSASMAWTKILWWRLAAACTSASVTYKTEVTFYSHNVIIYFIILNKTAIPMTGGGQTHQNYSEIDLCIHVEVIFEL